MTYTNQMLTSKMPQWQPHNLGEAGNITIAIVQE